MAKAPKKKIPEFDKQLKLILSSLSRRLNKYIYFNFTELESSIVVTNADYELLTTYAPVSLSIHLITFKDKENYNKIKSFFRIPDVPYVVRAEIIGKALVHNTTEELKVIVDTNDNMKIVLKENEEVTFTATSDEDDEFDSDQNDSVRSSFSSEENDELEDEEEYKIPETFSGKDICGTTITNTYAWKLLEESVFQLNDYSEEYFTKNKKFIINNIKPDEIDWYTSNLFRPVIIPQEILYKKVDEISNCYLVCIDGQDVVSVKEFMKKVKGTCNQYIWSNNGETIRCMAIYEDDIMVVKSTRPFYEIIPLTKKQYSIEDQHG